MAVSAAEEGKQTKQAEQEGDHRAGIFSGSALPDQSLGAGRSFGEGQGPVPRQNLIRLAQEHRDPSIRLQAEDPKPGWR